jgi:hypothetical protein
MATSASDFPMNHISGDFRSIFLAGLRFPAGTGLSLISWMVPAWSGRGHAVSKDGRTANDLVGLMASTQPRCE